MEHRVTPAEDGRRLREIVRFVMQVSYTAMKSAKWNNRILVDGQPRRVDAPVHAGETVTVLWEEHSAYQPKPMSLTLNVPYEDDQLLVVDKPAPLASQSGRNHPNDSLENALFAYFGCPDGFVYRPVNRLDRGTSGLMVVAKNPHMQQLLQRQLHTPDFCRGYLAVTDGVPQPLEGSIRLPIGKEDAASIRRIIDPAGKPSVTHYATLRQEAGRGLIRLRLETGRTHQIRVHLSAIGCPICGDFLYGTELPDLLPGRFALHSAELILRHPITGELLMLSSPLPTALLGLLASTSDKANLGLPRASVPNAR